MKGECRRGVCGRVWSLRWGMLRAGLAALLVWVLAVDHAGRLARLELAAVPGVDVPTRARGLVAEGKQGEALELVDAAMALTGAEDRPGREELAMLRREVEAADEGWMGVVGRAVRGAVTGRGDDAASLAGAVGSDMLVVGDVRDLGIEAARLVLDGRADWVVVGLSGVGLATTVWPGADGGVSALKWARRGSAGAQEGVSAAAVARHAPELVRAAGRSQSAAVLRAARSDEELARLTEFVVRHEASGAAAGALRLGGAGAMRMVAEGKGAGGAAEEVVLAVSGKGTAGVAWAEGKAARLTREGESAGAGMKRLAVLLRPHVVVGAAKGMWKGTLPALVERVIAALGRAAWWLMPAAVAWLVVEGWLLARGWARSGTASGKDGGGFWGVSTNGARTAAG